MNTDDPIAKQQRIVSNVTHGRVQYTVEHREALTALRRGEYPESVPEEIWKDLEILLQVLYEQLPYE